MKTLIKDNVWLIENFLETKEFEYLIDEYVNKDHSMNHIDNTKYEPVMADTDMSYRVLSMKLYKPIYDTLREHNFDIPEKQFHYLNMQYKKHLVNDSYALHSEDKKIYGDLAYIFYLTDEIDGDIVFPSKDEAILSKGFQEMMNLFEITFSEKTIRYTPKKNTCLIMKTGLAHEVKKCSGTRDTIAGWPWLKDTQN